MQVIVALELCCNCRAHHSREPRGYARANVENIHPEERLRIGRLKIVPAVKIGERGSCWAAFLSKDPGRSSKPKNSSR